MTPQDLIQRAEHMREKAYAPYSNFSVGAALLTEDGSVFTGCNVENAAYGACICAEQTAIVKAVSEGQQTFKAIAITAGSDDYCLPCGQCRQIMNEFAPNLEVLCGRADGNFLRYPLKELLPHAFRLEREGDNT